MKYKGIIVKESLEDPSILGSFEILSQESDSELPWQIYTVMADEETFEVLKNVIFAGKWYAHFWLESEIVAIFKDKLFRFNADDKSSWIPVIKYGQYLGIPEGQLNFPTDTQKAMYVFIDASNIWAAMKVRARFLDYEKLADYLRKKFSCPNIKVFYYTAYPADGTRSYSMDKKHKFFVYLKKSLAFEVRKKPLKRITVVGEHEQSIQEKGNMDVEMTIDAMHFKSKYDTAVFFTGDSDFLALVSYLRNAGKKVFIFSSKNNISQELKTGGDGYIDILSIKEDIWGNEIKHRANKTG